MNSCVEFANVSKSYGATAVLRNVSLEFTAGVTSAVVGASGSGKTTLLQLVNALERPDSGTVSVFGEQAPLLGAQTYRRGIGYSVQGAGLFPHMSVQENILLVPRLEGWDSAKQQQRLAELLEAMELPASSAARYPHELSGGQQQRVGLCRALVLRPRLLLLDEPFSAVDPITRVGIYETFARVQAADGVSTLLVTHDMREAVKLAQQLVILQDGQVLQSGETAEVLARPVNTYVETLVAAQL